MALTLKQKKDAIADLLTKLGYTGNINKIDEILKWYFGEDTIITRNGVYGTVRWQKIWNGLQTEQRKDPYEYVIYKLALRAGESQFYEDNGHLPSLDQ